jgi:hypothetical protein
MTVASFVISCLALVVAGFAAGYSRRQTRAAEQSAAEAKQSADAAAEMARIEQERRDEEVAEADRHRVHFELEHQNASAYLMRNTGTDSAYGVHVDLAGMLSRGDVDFDEFRAGEAHKLVLMKAASTDDGIVITWHQHPDRSDPQRSARLYVE